ncbi:uncharacterized protein LOC126843282 [Adelges cooleyi]|uniref:uncharacterized protein LOC126843282 n=1 Tax=Adelges cooleyi TaxID=133065 RepID=UPI00217FD08D|nr:uncharacterized protein LOC126843282 [Adelges cooleyi]
MYVYFIRVCVLLVVYCRCCCTAMRSFHILLLAVNAVVFIYGDQCEALPVSNLARYEFLKDVMAADDVWMPVLIQQIKRNQDGEKVIIAPGNYDLLEDLEVSTEIEPFLVLNNLIVSGGYKGTAVDYAVYVMRTALTCMTLKYVSLLMHLTTYLIELGAFLARKIKDLANPELGGNKDLTTLYLTNTRDTLNSLSQDSHKILCETCTENPVYQYYDKLGVKIDFRIFDDSEKAKVSFNEIILMATNTEKQMGKTYSVLPLTQMKLVLWEDNTEPYEDIEDTTVQ